MECFSSCCQATLSAEICALPLILQMEHPPDETLLPPQTCPAHRAILYCHSFVSACSICRPSINLVRITIDIQSSHAKSVRIRDNGDLVGEARGGVYLRMQVRTLAAPPPCPLSPRGISSTPPSPMGENSHGVAASFFRRQKKLIPQHHPTSAHLHFCQFAAGSHGCHVIPRKEKLSVPLPRQKWETA